MSFKNQFIKGATLNYRCGGTRFLKQPRTEGQHLIEANEVWWISGKYGLSGVEHDLDIISITPPAKKYRMKTVEELIAEGFELSNDCLSFGKKHSSTHYSSVQIASVVKFQIEKNIFDEIHYLCSKEFYVEVTE